MRILRSNLIALLLIATLTLYCSSCGEAKKSSRSRAAAPPPRRADGGRSERPRSGASPRRRVYEDEEEYEEDDEEFGFPEDLDEDAEYDEYEEDEEEEVAPRSRRPPSRSRQPPPKRSKPRKNRPRNDYDDEEEYDRPRYSRDSRRGPSSRKPSYDRDSRHRGPPSGRSSVVPYANQAGSTFTRGLAALRESIPDPTTVKNAAVSGFNVARETTSSLSSGIYREVKGLTSSELEQVMLKATRPDDTAVKGKHVERLVGVTYQISSRYDIYDAVLRKLWSKMAEKDWRTTIKALYILHRFCADGAPEHAPALKARLRELRRTRDPKRKDKYFNSKQLLSGDAKPENKPFRAFMARYAHYVLLRAQCFGGMFVEISQPPKVDKKKTPKPITATSLRTEHLEAAAMLLKAGIACQLKEGEECENTAIACERVASDLIGLTSAIAIALNRVLKSDTPKGVDTELIGRWCEFYKDECLPKTKAMIKKISPTLDTYGLFLPSRMGATVSPELLEKGLQLTSSVEGEDTAEQEDGSAEAADKEEQTAADEEKADVDAKEEPGEVDEAAVDEEEEYEEEYEYEDEEYYDDEELE